MPLPSPISCVLCIHLVKRLFKSDTMKDDVPPTSEASRSVHSADDDSGSRTHRKKKNNNGSSNGHSNGSGTGRDNGNVRLMTDVDINHPALATEPSIASAIDPSSFDGATHFPRSNLSFTTDPFSLKTVASARSTASTTASRPTTSMSNSPLLPTVLTEVAHIPVSPLQRDNWADHLPPSEHVKFFKETNWAATHLGPLKTWSYALRLHTFTTFADSLPACLYCKSHPGVRFNP